MIRGRLVQLRTFRESDIRTVHELSEDFDDMGDFWPCDFMSLRKLEKHYQESGCFDEHSGNLLVTSLDDSRILGQIFFFKGIPYGTGYEIGYRIYKPRDMGKGYVSEALRLLVGYLFSRKPCERIQATAIKGNQASLKVMEKCGFQREGILRKALFHHGRNMDLVMNSITRAEWEGSDPEVDQQ